jgi:hypothetical protein
LAAELAERRESHEIHLSQERAAWKIAIWSSGWEIQSAEREITPD